VEGLVELVGEISNVNIDDFIAHQHLGEKRNYYVVNYGTGEYVSETMPVSVR